jgi:ParB-like chromosome segregation protein Spo0J
MKIERINVAELSLDPANVRKHDRKNLDAIKASLRKFGQQKPIVVDAKGIVLAGNGTLTAAKELGWTEIEITRTTLQGVEATAFAIADNRSAELAEWEEDKLGEVLRSLQDGGFDLASIGYSKSDFDSLVTSTLSDDYTHKVDAPVYTPKGDKPPVVQLFNSERADDLLSKIEASKAPDEVKRFLKTAAARHIVFDYGKIAEFYCHADKETQALMEDSALVIIDFKKAMQLGYVKLKAEIADALESEEGGGEEQDADE